MRLPRGFGAGLLAVTVLAAGVAVPGDGLAAPPPPTGTPRPAPGGERTVTLVTGDRVTVYPGGRVSVRPGSGRAGVRFVTTTDRGRVSVLPSDAVPLLAAGRLDPRLFEVTGLVESGYDRRNHLPLIVTAAPDASNRRGGSGGAPDVGGIAGLEKVRDLPVVGGVAVRQPHGGAAESWRALVGGGEASARTLRNGVGKIWLDGLRQPALDVSVPRVGAPAAWAAGFRGAGSTVAVLDSGIDDSHPDLEGQVVARRNFTEGFEPDADLSGHGTHVAATVAGTGAGRFTGVAPGAKLLDGKVCGLPGCPESWILAGMEWAAADQRAKVVNLSLGGEDDPAVVDPVEAAVQSLSEQYGTLFVVSAGNTDGGVVEGAISSPGTAEAALTVGAVDDADAVADFSRRGPNAPDDGLKPEITAPGVGIEAARGRDAADVPGAPGDGYTTLSGTSMAAPHVAGAAAILAQRHPDWSGQQLKAALMASATPNPDHGVYAQGAGRLDLARAVRQPVTAAPGGIGFARQAWPHSDDPVQVKDLSYTNSGSAPVTLTLATETYGPDGTPLPAGTFTVDPPSVLVPAGGTATVRVSADTRVPGPDGHLGGWLTATAGDLVVRTPVAVHREVESYDVTLTHLDRAGAASSSFSTQLTKRDSATVQFGWRGDDDGDGVVTVRVPAGHYTLAGMVQTPLGPGGGDADGDGKPDPVPTSAALLAQPDLVVDRPRAVTLDARLARPVSVTVPRPSARQVTAEVAAYTERPGGTAGVVVLGESFANLFTGRIGPDTTTDRFTSIVAGQWAQADAAGGTDDSPYLYSLFYPVRGRMTHGYQRAVADRELAEVCADFARSGAATIGTKRVRNGLADLGVGNFGPDLRFRLPFRRTEYYNTDPGVEVGGDFLEWVADEPVSRVTTVTETAYQAGRTYVERWNRAVFGPVLPPTDGEWPGVSRLGNTITVGVPLHGDGAGRPGDSTLAGGEVALFSGGERVGGVPDGPWGSIEAPAGDGAYRLEVRAERAEPFALSTRTELAWTFRSGTVAGTAPESLPVWVVRFAPELDAQNSAPAGRLHAVPVVVAAQPGARVGTLVRRTVEVSFDDGASWRPATVQDGAAQVRTPAGSGYVSLRASAADSAGNAVTQTIIRAYRYAPTR
ncbi:S8 family serine peptidase [Plantactinospora sp. DSM 117369]